MKQTVLGNSIKASIRDQVVKLLDQHYEKIDQFRDETDGNTVKIVFPVSIDFSPAEPRVDVDMKFSLKDSSTESLPDPNQTEMTTIKSEAEAEGKKKKRKAKRKQDDAENPDS
jgi:hypothetical protein